jgi:anti-sigma factor RsiW
MMNTGSAWMNRLQGFIDGELDAVQALEVAAHLIECASCTQAHASAIALRCAMRLEGVRALAPDHLFSRLDAAAKTAGSRCAGERWHGGAAVLARPMPPDWRTQCRSRSRD